ncbi:homoserine O-acetyltransferase, partial [Jaminaea rosea]
PFPIEGPTSPQSSMIATGQNYLVFPHFTLESGITLKNVPIAYKTWGKLDPVRKDNVLVVAHALTGSADVEDWWGPLLGPGKLFDPTRFFIFCANVLGSPYGSGSPCTRKDGEDCDATTGRFSREAEWSGEGWWGPEFPATTVRDDVAIQKLVLDYLGVEAIFACIGGSMGGMSVLEWPLCFPVRFPKGAGEAVNQRPYISAIIPIATAARHGAWCISWAEAQRQSIYSDPLYLHGYYPPNQTPRAGLAAARMAALLTYRSRDSFESRFGRRTGSNKAAASPAIENGSTPAVHERRASVNEESAMAHNEGNKTPRASTSPPSKATTTPSTAVFSAQSYLRYQGDKFVKRFDANCYVHLTRKMDTHDLARGRAHWGVLPGEKRLPHGGEEDDEALSRVLGFLGQGKTRCGGVEPPFVHVVSISSDGLFQTPEQRLIHQLIPGSTFQEVGSPEGHDGFLLEFEAIGTRCTNVLRSPTANAGQNGATGGGHLGQVKESVFGEVEDLTRW